MIKYTNDYKTLTVPSGLGNFAGNGGGGSGVTEQEVYDIVNSAITDYDIEIQVDLEDIRENVSGNTEDIQALSGTTESISESITAITTSMDNLSGAVTSLTEGLETLSAATQNMGSDVDTLSAATENIGSNVDTLSAATENIQSDINNLSGATENIGSNVDTLSAATENMQSDINGLSAATQNIGSNVDNLSGATAAIESNLGTVSGATAQNAADLAALSAQTIDLSGATVNGISGANQAANSAYTLADSAMTAVGELSASTTALTESVATLSGVVETKQDEISAGNGIEISGATVSVKIGEGLAFSGDTLVTTGGVEKVQSLPQNPEEGTLVLLEVSAETVQTVTMEMTNSEKSYEAGYEVAVIDGNTFSCDGYGSQYGVWKKNDQNVEYRYRRDYDNRYFDFKVDAADITLGNDADSLAANTIPAYYKLYGFTKGEWHQLDREWVYEIGVDGTAVDLFWTAYSGLTHKELDYLTVRYKIDGQNREFKPYDFKYFGMDFQASDSRGSEDGNFGKIKINTYRLNWDGFNDMIGTQWTPNSSDLDNAANDITIRITDISTGAIETGPLGNLSSLAKFNRIQFMYVDDNVSASHCSAPLTYFWRRNEEIDGQEKLIEYIGCEIEIFGTTYRGEWRFAEWEWGDNPLAADTWEIVGREYDLDAFTADEAIALYNYLWATVGEHTEQYRGKDRFFITLSRDNINSRVQLTLAAHLYKNSEYFYVFSAVAQSVTNSQLYQTAYAIGESGTRGVMVNANYNIGSIGNDKYVLVSDSAGTVTLVNQQITGSVYNQISLIWEGNNAFGKGKLDYFDIRWETINGNQVAVFYIGGWCPVDGTVYRGSWHWVDGQWPTDQSPLAPDTWEPVYDALRKPDVIYQTDGTTGLLGHNQNAVTGNWQIENLDLTPYAYVKCYFACGTATGDSRTPAVVVTVPLDAASIGPDGYIGSTVAALPFNRNRVYTVSCAVDSTKTKFQVIHQNSLWDITANDANSAGRYCYKIEGWYN